MQLAAWRPMARVLAERDLWQTRCVREFKFFQVFAPISVELFAQFDQVIPGIQSGVMAIVEGDSNGIVTDSLDLRNLNVFFAANEGPLFGSMPTDLSEGEYTRRYSADKSTLRSSKVTSSCRDFR